MAIKYTNPYKKEESSVIVTDREALQVISILENGVTQKQMQTSLKTMDKALQAIKNVNRKYI